MEAKLKEYRARRRREEFVEKTTEQIGNTKRRFIDLFKKMIKINIEESNVDVAPIFKEAKVPQEKVVPKNKTRLEDNKAEDQRRLLEIDAETNEDDVLDEKPPETWQHFIIKWTFYTVIWVTLYFYFITLQFGAVFFAISLLIGIYLNTGTRPRKRGEASAYSVFNENCESIEGTVTAEKLQNEMFFGSFRLF